MNNDYNNNDNQKKSDQENNRWDQAGNNGQNTQNGQGGYDNQGNNGQYYNPNGQYYNPNGQYYNQGNNGQYYNPNGQYYNGQGNPHGNPYANGGQFHPDSFFYPPQQTDASGKTAQTFGIIALIGLLFCQILSIVFGALALSNAKRSVMTVGYECPEAKGGRVMGLIGLILGIVQVVVGLVYAVIMIALLV